jgi:hypothetical protein
LLFQWLWSTFGWLCSASSNSYEKTSRWI